MKVVLSDGMATDRYKCFPRRQMRVKPRLHASLPVALAGELFGQSTVIVSYAACQSLLA